MERILNVDEIASTAQTVAGAVKEVGGNTHSVLDAPATVEEVEYIEEQLGFSIPENFRMVLLTTAKQFHFDWFLPDGLELAAPFHEVFSGQFFWKLDYLVELEKARQDWIRVCFPDPTDPYDIIWHDKFSFQDVPNGDHLALDLRPEFYGQVVYLSHDDGEGHGRVLAPSFTEFVQCWAKAGFVGPEDWQWFPFYNPVDGKLCDDDEVLKAFIASIEATPV